MLFEDLTPEMSLICVGNSKTVSDHAKPSVICLIFSQDLQHESLTRQTESVRDWRVLIRVGLLLLVRFLAGTFLVQFAVC